MHTVTYADAKLNDTDTAIALIDVDSLSRLQVAIDGAFAEHGYTGPTVFTVTPSDGAKAEQ